MIAQHPITGKEIRVIQTEASLWRENKTLSYGTTPSIWETVSDKLLDDGTAPMYRILLSSSASSDEEVRKASKSSQIILLSNVVVKTIGLEKFKRLGLDNVLCLDEIHLMYPHLGGAWDGSVEDAAILMAGLLRYRRVAGVWNERAVTLGLYREQKPPAQLWFITQFFKHSNPDRAAEIRKCLRENTSSKLISKIILMNESPQKYTDATKGKVQEEIIGRRLTYQDVFERIYDIPDNTIVVFANADIFIDDSFKELWSLNLEDKFLALLRYDLPASGDISEARIFGPRADSQDTWVVRSDDVKRRDRSCWQKLNFKFGKMGCDNGIAMEMLRQKFLVINPSQTIRTYHVHSSEIRNYSKDDVLDMPIFHYIQPSGIHDLNPEFKLEKGATPAVLKSVVRGSEEAVKAWKTCIKEPFEEVFVPSAEQRIVLKGPCFQTTNGLVFDSKKMYIGETEVAKNLWTNSKIHGLMSTMEIGRALVAPWPCEQGSERGDSREIYCLRYLSKILRLWATEKGEFFCSENPGFEEVLHLFNWNSEILPIIAREENSLLWCKEGAVGFCHEGERVLKEDIDALRLNLRTWSADVRDGKKLVIMEDGVVLTKEFVLKIEAELEDAGFDVRIVYPKKTSLERIRDMYCGAWGIISASDVSAVGWNWILPNGANVFEVSSKTLGIEISTASNLVHWFVKKDGIVEQILEVTGKEIVNKDLPTIWMPVASGFFAHPGDSFREMVRLWQKAGYVNVCEHPTATQVWWGSVGTEGVLLYDRPTNEWRLAAPVEEREWKLALFGNPKVPVPNGLAWTFWPRRPSLVEGLVTAGAAEKGYDERCAGPVFYGKTENAIQERRRKGDWKSVCSEWVMVKGDEKYPFTQTEYLEKLAGARFGLCLPGYGLKCHREIECMAMGCVPIVSKGVDMDSYAVPPVEGVHYLRADEPSDVPNVLVSKDAWERMSAACKLWWKENASCEGSFRLTARLARVKI